MTNPRSIASTEKIWCVIPVFNNAGTIRRVVEGCLEQLPAVLVVDDGSTDASLRELLADLSCTVLTHETNAGKGRAIRTALNYIREQGGTHMVTLDGDGQHDPADLAQFPPAIAENPEALIIGVRNFQSPEVPGSSRFGRRLSNLWIKIETGHSLQDTQSGFRSYPVDLTSRLHLRTKSYDFEIEVITRSAWAGLPIKEVPIHVKYPDDRVSSFHPFTSNLGISLTHARLVGRRMIPWPHKRLLPRRDANEAWQLLKSPKTFFLALLKENTSPAELAAAAGLGTFLAVLPLIGLHTVAIIYSSARLHLNKVMATAIQVFFSPPGSPFLCIQLGFFLRHGHWWTEYTRRSLTLELHQRLFEWLLGSLILAPLFAAITATLVFFISLALKIKMGQQNAEPVLDI